MKEKLEKLKGLCDLFRSNIKEYKSGKYDEANTRVDFIDKFFECLDWDVRNNQGLTESNREVVREDKVIIDKKPKAPDYSFRIGGYRKFFLEAKKPSVNVKEEIEPAFQIRRYGYTAKLSLSILTDFEEFAVYDTRIKPNKNDKANIARIFYCTFEDYEKQFDFLYNTFSKGAILNGSFDKYALENKIKKGSSEVDKEFLSLIEDWRESLAKNIAIRNKDLDIYSLNSAVQVIIDRIIFLRIAEDRKMEVYGMLLDACNQGVNNRSNIPTYQYLNQIFIDANKKYNSGLFYPKKWISDLSIDDKIFQTIIRNLYYPECPYELSVLPIEILGNIYEQFLGKTIRLTSGHQAKVEEKEDVRKAGGVYYTPQYIVNYIVQNTVGEKIKGIDLYNHPKLTILDPACGSGSFLVGAYSFLLEKYLESYTDKKRLDKSLKNGLIYQVSHNTYRLSITVKQNILLHHIFGVDIDNQAVEVTKLSLLLKLMEDENTESADRLFKHSDLKLLPDLDNNIKCGNSLIASDFYEDKNLSLFGKEEMRKMNTFDWEKEFPTVFPSATIKKKSVSGIEPTKGGFDVIIGNPPYVLIGSDRNKEKDYYINQYKFNAYKVNTYILFLEKSLNILNHNDALLGLIIPKSLAFNTYFAETRKKILAAYTIPKLVEIKDKVFINAEVGDSLLFFAQKKQKNNISNKLDYFIVENIYPSFRTLEKHTNSQKELLKNKDYSFIKKGLALKVKTVNLSEICSVFNGLNPGNVRHILFSTKKETNRHKHLLLGRDIQKYFLKWSGTWVNYDVDLKNKIKITDIKSKQGMTPQNKIDFALRSPAIFIKHKIIIRKTADHIVASYDDFGYYIDSLAHSVILKNGIIFSIFYVLGLLNSKLLNFFHSELSKNEGKVFAKVLAINIEQLPIALIDFKNKAQKSQHDKLVSMVEQMLSAQKEVHSAVSESDKKILQQKCDLLDKQIDKIVYELYGLTEAEIKIVEGN